MCVQKLVAGNISENTAFGQAFMGAKRFNFRGEISSENFTKRFLFYLGIKYTINWKMAL